MSAPDQPEQDASLALQGAPVSPKLADELGIPEKELREYITSMVGCIHSVGVERAHIGDVLDNAFVTACGKPKEERPDRNDRNGFGKWLCAFAINAALAHVRDRHRSREELVGDEAIEMLVDAARSVQIVEERIDVEAVFKALSPAEGYLLYQHYYEDKEIAEMAKEEGVPWSTMRSRVDRVLDRARIVLENSPARRRFGAMAFPVVLFGLLIRDARAHVRAVCRWVGGWFTQRPMCLLGGLAGFAAVVGWTPPSHPLAMPRDVHASVETSSSARIEETLQSVRVVIAPVPGIRRADGSLKPPRSRAPVLRQYKKRSSEIVVKSNAIGHGDRVNVDQLFGKSF